MREVNKVLFSILFFAFAFFFLSDSFIPEQVVRKTGTKSGETGTTEITENNADLNQTLDGSTSVKPDLGNSEGSSGDIRPDIQRADNIPVVADNFVNPSPSDPISSGNKNSFVRLNPIDHRFNGSGGEADDYFSSFPGNNNLGFSARQPAVFFGASLFLFNNWLINSKTLNGLGSNDLVQTVFDFSTPTGFVFGINPGNRSGFQIEWIPNARTGQSYYNYTDGEYQLSTVRLTYHHLNLIHKFKWQNHNGKTYRSGNLLTGTNLRFLQAAVEKTGNTYRNISSGFNNDDFGIYIGYEYERLFLTNFIFSASIVSNIGLSDIRKRDFSVPGYFNRTQNFSLGLNAGIRYAF